PADTQPAEAVPPARPAQLPAELATFAGRQDEMATVLALSGASTPTAATVVIGGMGRIRKTPLPVHWAPQVADQYLDGQLYVNLRGFDPTGTVMSPTEALFGFLRALGVPPGHIPNSVDALAGLYRSTLAGRRVLVLLDNARDMAQVCPLL